MMQFLKMAGATISDTGVRYFLFAGIGWLLGYVFFRRRWFYRKIVQRFPDSSDVRREIKWSLLTLLVYGVVGAVTSLPIRWGWSRMYFKIEEWGWYYFFASIVLTVLLHDAYFYWTHRAMHSRLLFKWFHSVHHLSHNPSPWAAYAFSPLEAAVQAGIFPLTVFVMPIHPLAFYAFMMWQIAINVVGHTGYEFWPRWMLDSWLGKFWNTPTHHAMHHEVFRANYGLYFNYWDRLFGTNHETYEARFREVTSRAKQNEPSEPADVPVYEHT